MGDKTRLVERVNERKLDALDEKTKISELY
jgi:hypothetical protein